MDDVARVAEGMSEAQRQYVSEGPYPHWTRTKHALERKGMVSYFGMLSDLGLAVRNRLMAEKQ